MPAHTPSWGGSLSLALFQLKSTWRKTIYTHELKQWLKGRWMWGKATLGDLSCSRTRDNIRSLASSPKGV